MSGLKVLVVGASIAGPATAYWLAKAGAKVTVIERFPKLRTGGQAVDIRTAGVSVMRKMAGMEAAVRAKFTQLEGVSFVRRDGWPFGTIYATGNPDEQSLISEYEILRGDLSRILFDMTEAHENVNYVWGEQVASISQNFEDGEPIKVEFANGHPASEYDLVVGCDGVNSRTRAMGFDCGVREHIVPTGSWTSYFTIAKDLLNGSKVGKGYSAVGGRFISIGPASPGRNSVMVTRHPGKDHNSTLSFRQALSEGDEAIKRYISQQFQAVGWKSDVVMDEMMLSEDLYASEIVQVKMPTPCRGRCVLVGDAGYAAGPTGGGTSLALTGAYILAGEISKREGDLTAALKRYEEQMRPIIAEMQKIPPFVSTIMAPQTWWGILLRNYVFAFVAWSGVIPFVTKYLGNAFASTEAFPLPEYQWLK